MQDILGRQDNDGGLEIKDSWRMQVDEEPLELVTRKSEERGKRDESWSRSAGRKKRQSSKVLTGRLTHFDAAVLCLTVCCSELTEQTHSADLLSECQSLRQGCVQGQSHDHPFLPLSLFAGYTAHTGNTGWERHFFIVASLVLWWGNWA